jgi:PAS domain S-box-containing protein
MSPFSRNRRRDGLRRDVSPMKLLLLTAGAVLAAETLVMLLLNVVGELHYVVGALLDAVMVTALVVPALYLFLYRPMSGHIARLAEAEADLRKFATFISQSHEAIVITDPTGAIQYVNPAFERITGYTRGEAIGQNPRILKSGVHSGPFYRSLWETIGAGRVWSGFMVNKRKDGATFEEEAIITPLLDAAGKVTHFVAIKRDITAERGLERRIRQSQKLEAIGTLAGGIAHDFNNILSAIIGYTEMTLEEIERNSEPYDNLLEVLRASHRARDLVRQILTFSRKSGSEMKPVKLQPIIKESLKLLRATLPPNIEMRQEIETFSGSVMADPTQMSQVMMNLCANAAHAMVDGGIIAVSLKVVEVDKAFAAAQGDLAPGVYQRLSVSDTGHGMDKETLDRIFEPFYTTKKAGEGTGLGLAAVHGIVTAHKGAITVYSEPAKGAIFDIYLPQCADDEGEDELTLIAAAPRGTERILFVDDEAPLARMMEKGLGRLGYRVSGYTNPAEALAVFNEAADRWDLVITDLSMPQVSGKDLMTKMRQRRPDLPVVLLTGYSDTLNREEALALGANEYLFKPVAVHELAAVARAVLDEAARRK